MRRLAGLFAAALLAAGLAAVAKEPQANARLHALFEREFRYGLNEFPERATFLGIDGFNDRLTDRSPGAIARRKEHTRQIIAELRKFDGVALSTQDRISRDVMLSNLKLDAEEDALYGELPFSSADTWQPLTPAFGPHQGMAALAKSTRFRTAKDYEDFVKRLEGVPARLSELTESLRVAMRSGWMPPAEALVRVPGTFTVFAGEDVKASPLWRPFEAFPTDMAAADRARLAEAGRRVLAEQVHPAFAQLRRFVEAQYLPAARKTLAASDLPAGARYYELRVRRMTTTALSAAQIHATGLAEVARIRGEMERVIATTGFKGSFAEFIHFINTDKQFFFTKPEDRLAAYRDIAKRADAELPKLFAELPRTPYGIRAMEAYEGDNADNYSRPALDGSRAGFFNANVNNLGTRPSHEMEAVLLHETVPGHHLQIARAQELPGIPIFRRAGGYVAYSEGWALYAESLGYEMGFYKDPYMRFGALAMEMMRACRLVIDTGLHSKGWGREQSIKYMMDNAGLKEGFATAEIDRYILNAGQALGYKIGELKIKELRAAAQQALGDKFEVRRFHNAVLDDGALPLTVLEARIKEWVAAERKAPVKPKAKAKT